MESVAVYVPPGNIALQGGGAHWANGISSFISAGPESYITNPGGAQETAMARSLTGISRKLFTDLDLAGLTDIGWQVSTIPLPAGFWMLLSGAVMLLLRQRPIGLAPAR